MAQRRPELAPDTSAIDEDLDSLLYHLHRMKHADHPVADLRRRITDLEQVKAELEDARSATALDRIIRRTYALVEDLRDALPTHRLDDRWLHDRVALIRMCIDSTIEGLDALGG